MAERLWLMRHGEAALGAPDRERALTDHGREEAGRMAAWLAGQHGVGEARLLASPYRRALQSAAALAEALEVEIEPLALITPDDAPEAVSDWLLEQPAGRPLILVSHMPLVGALTGLLVEGRTDRGLGFPTAAVAELEAEVWAAGCARLARFVSPADLG